MKTLYTISLYLLLAVYAYAHDPHTPLFDATGWHTGGQSIVNPNLGSTTDIPVKTKARTPLTSFNACAKINPKDSLKDMFQHLNGTLFTMADIPSATLSSLPGYTICRAKPGLCQLAQEYTARLEQQLRTHTTSCRQSVQSVLEGNSPYADWVLATETELWVNAGHKGLPSLETYRNIAQSRDAGMLWIGGIRAGGKSQKQIQPLRQIAHAGWCIVQGKQPACEDGDVDSYYFKLWPTAPAFKAWIVSVLGDIGLWVYENAPPPESISGHGLDEVVRLQEERVATQLKAILAKDKEDISASDLSALSTRNIQMDIELLEAFEESSQRIKLAPSLINRIALGQTVDMAILAKKILHAANREYHVQTIGPARHTVASAIQRLQAEIDMLLHDSQVQNQLLQAHAQFIFLTKNSADLRNRQHTSGR